MDDLLQLGAEWLDEHRRESNSQAVKYVRPGLGEADIAASFGEGKTQVTDEANVGFTVKSRDFVVTRPITIAGTDITPRQGDKIEWTKDGVAYTFEVNNLGFEPEHRDHDRYNLAWRIHTDLCDEEDQ